MQALAAALLPCCPADERGVATPFARPFVGARRCLATRLAEATQRVEVGRQLLVLAWRRPTAAMGEQTARAEGNLILSRWLVVLWSWARSGGEQGRGEARAGGARGGLGRTLGELESAALVHDWEHEYVVRHEGALGHR